MHASHKGEENNNAAAAFGDPVIFTILQMREKEKVDCLLCFASSPFALFFFIIFVSLLQNENICSEGGELKEEKNE